MVPPDVLAELKANPTDTAALSEGQQAVANSDLANNPASAVQRILQLHQASGSDLQLLIACATGSAG